MFRVTLEEDKESRYSYRSILRVWYNDECILEELDCGEPEDNSFGRDYSWIKPIIEKAYHLGVIDGAKTTA